MADLNEVRLIGRLTRDPIVRSTPKGMTVGDFGLATSKKYKAQDGTLKEDTVFVDITCFAKMAENVGKYLKKGSAVFVGGRLKLDTWQDKTTGANRQKLSVIAENIQFLGEHKNSQDQSNNIPMAKAPSMPASSNFSWTEEAPDFGQPPF